MGVGAARVSEECGASVCCVIVCLGLFTLLPLVPQLLPCPSPWVLRVLVGACVSPLVVYEVWVVGLLGSLSGILLSDLVGALWPSKSLLLGALPGGPPSMLTLVSSSLFDSPSRMVGV